MYYPNSNIVFNLIGLLKIYPIQEALQKVNDFISAIDFNNDGTINFSEFVTATMEKSRLLSENMLQKAFHMFDIVNILFNTRTGLVTLLWRN